MIFFQLAFSSVIPVVPDRFPSFGGLQPIYSSPLSPVQLSSSLVDIMGFAAFLFCLIGAVSLASAATTLHPDPQSNLTSAFRSKMSPFSRILNGQLALEGEFRHQVLLEAYSIEPQQCSGSIINSETILTAARCVMYRGAKLDPEHLTVHFGDVNRLKMKTKAVKKVIVHPKFQMSEVASKYDFALVEIKGTFPVHWRPIHLVNPNYEPKGKVAMIDFRLFRINTDTDHTFCGFRSGDDCWMGNSEVAGPRSNIFKPVESISSHCPRQWVRKGIWPAACFQLRLQGPIYGCPSDINGVCGHF